MTNNASETTGTTGTTGKNSQPVAETGELRCAGARFPLHGRVLRLALWLAAHQTRINDAAPESGQIWMSWKGQGPHSITGDIKTPL